VTFSLRFYRQHFKTIIAGHLRWPQLHLKVFECKTEAEGFQARNVSGYGNLIYDIEPAFNPVLPEQ
jgi:hypothetical protein